MLRSRSTFRKRTRRILTKHPHVRNTVTGASLNWTQKRLNAMAEIDAEAWRDWARAVKDHLLTHLDTYLEQAEKQLRKLGAKVHWANDTTATHHIVERLVREEQIKKVVKAKSMLSEELGINPFLESLDIEVFETDLGEYIIQLLDEPPSHIVGPAIHLSVKEIRQLFHERLGTSLQATPEELTAQARQRLRQAFLDADLGISGANFLVAETGTLALIENEGNIRLSTSAPRIHLALVGIEKLLPSFSDLALFLQLTPRAATGQRIGNYVSLIHGPRRSSESDGPAALHVILVDNGRTRLLNDFDAWEILRCVRCGACLNICPVFRQVGGHAWGWAYSGPIGTVLAQGILGLNQAWPLLYACTLCGACTEVCPVRVPLHRLILAWRARAAAMKLPGWTESMAMKSFAHRLSQPLNYQRASTLLRHFPASWRDALVPFFRTWAKGRYHLAPSPKSFHELWLDQEGE